MRKDTALPERNLVREEYLRLKAALDKDIEAHNRRVEAEQTAIQREVLLKSPSVFVAAVAAGLPGTTIAPLRQPATTFYQVGTTIYEVEDLSGWLSWDRRGAEPVSTNEQFEEGTYMGDLIDDLTIPGCEADFDIHHDAFVFKCGLGISGEVVRMSGQQIKASVIADMKRCHKTHHDKDHESHGEAWSFLVAPRANKIEVTCPTP